MKAKDNSPIKTISIKKVYSNPWLSVEEHIVETHEGKRGLYGVLDYGDGVCTLAVDNNDNIFLIKEYKYAVKKFMYQLPAGSVEKGELPLRSAKRELLEETGLKAGKWKYLGITKPFPTNITTTVSLYLATNLKQVREPEPGVHLYKFPILKVKEMVLQNKITHSGSVVCLLKYFLTEK